MTETSTDAELTERELQILQLIGNGWTSGQISHLPEFSVTENTINNWFGVLRRKLGAANRYEAVKIGVKRGLIT